MTGIQLLITSLLLRLLLDTGQEQPTTLLGRFGVSYKMIWAAILGIIGSVIYRVRGIDEITIVSRTVERLLMAFLVSSVTLFSIFSVSWLWFGLFIVATAGAYLGVITGHGAYYHLWYKGDDIKIQYEDDEKMKPIVKFLTGGKLEPINGWYKAIGLGLTGLAITLIPGICFLSLKGSMLAGILIMLSGLVKVPCYALGIVFKKMGLEVEGKFKLVKGTQWGELLFGFALLFILGLINFGI